MTPSTTGVPVAGVSSWPKDLFRVTFGVVWLVDAVLKWLPGFRNNYMSNLMGEAQGQPAVLRGWFDFWINLQHARVDFFVDVVALAETLIALALILGFARKLTYVAAIALSLLIWSTAEGFGGPYTSGSADIGTAIIYALVFLGLLSLSYYTGPSRLSVDYYLESHVSWWWRLAEVRWPPTLKKLSPGFESPTKEMITTAVPFLPSEAVAEGPLSGGDEVDRVS